MCSYSIDSTERGVRYLESFFCIKSTGAVDAVFPGLDFIAQGYVNDIPGRFLIDAGGCHNSDIQPTVGEKQT